MKLNLSDNQKNISAVLLGLIVALIFLLYADSFFYDHRDYFAPEPVKAKPQDQASQIPLEAFDLNEIKNLVERDRDRYTGHASVPTAKEASDPNSRLKKYKQKKMMDFGKVLYEVTYTEDENKRRVTAESNEQNSDDAAIVFIGCSQTYGIGVQDDETVPSFLAQSLKNKPVLNAAKPNYGPNDIYEDILNKKAHFENIKQRKIIIVYGLIANHFIRMTCNNACFRNEFSQFMDKPRYVLKDGVPVQQGRHGDLYRKPFLYNIMNSFKSLTEGPFVFPDLNTTENRNLYYALLDGIRREFSKDHEVIDFYQLYYAHDQGNPLFYDYLIQGDQKNIKPVYVPYADIGEKIANEKAFLIPFDGHNTPAGNFVAAEALKYRLQKDHPELFSLPK